MRLFGTARRTSRLLLATCVLALLPGVATAQAQPHISVRALPNVAPNRIILGPDSNLWFAEMGAIGRITPAGAIKSYPIPHHADDQPSGLTVGPDGAIWFLLPDTVGRITTSETMNTATISSLYGGHMGDPKSESVGDLIVGPDKQLWYLNADSSGYHYIMEISHLPSARTTTLPGKINLQNTLESDFVNTDKAIDPRHLVSGNDGSIWFIEYQENPAFPLDIRIGQIARGNRVRLFPIPLQTLVGHYTKRPEQACEQGVCLPDDLTQTADGAVWFTMLIPLLGHISPSGKVSSVAEKPVPGQPRSVCQQGIPATIMHDGQGNVWYAELTAQCINRITPKGVVSTIVSPRGLDNIDGLVADGHGNIWFTLECVNSIGRLTPQGDINIYHIPHTAEDAGQGCPVTL